MSTGDPRPMYCGYCKRVIVNLDLMTIVSGVPFHSECAVPAQLYPIAELPYPTEIITMDNTNQKLLDRLQNRADSAYIEYLNACKADECLGWEIKVEKGLFGEDELKAHKRVGEKLGKYRTLVEIIKLIKEDD